MHPAILGVVDGGRSSSGFFSRFDGLLAGGQEKRGAALGRDCEEGTPPAAAFHTAHSAFTHHPTHLPHIKLTLAVVSPRISQTKLLLLLLPSLLCVRGVPSSIPCAAQVYVCAIEVYTAGGKAHCKAKQVNLSWETNRLAFSFLFPFSISLTISILPSLPSFPNQPKPPAPPPPCLQLRKLGHAHPKLLLGRLFHCVDLQPAFPPHRDDVPLLQLCVGGGHLLYSNRLCGR